MIKGLVLAITLLAGSLPTHLSAATEDFSMTSERATRSYQEMLDVRLIRVLVVSSKTNYFVDRAQQRGISYDMLKVFEDQLNEKLGTRHLLEEHSMKFSEIDYNETRAECPAGISISQYPLTS